MISVPTINPTFSTATAVTIGLTLQSTGYAMHDTYGMIDHVIRDHCSKTIVAIYWIVGFSVLLIFVVSIVRLRKYYYWEHEGNQRTVVSMQ